MDVPDIPRTCKAWHEQPAPPSPTCANRQLVSSGISLPPGSHSSMLEYTAGRSKGG